MLTYMLALLFITLLLLCAVRLHLSLGLDQGKKGTTKGDTSHSIRPEALRDLIFQDLAE